MLKLLCNRCNELNVPYSQLAKKRNLRKLTFAELTKVIHDSETKNRTIHILKVFLADQA